MAKVITLSRTFPKGNPKVGQPTYFVEKVWESLWKYTGFRLQGLETSPLLNDEVNNYQTHDYTPKKHTIRGGKRWKTGDKASLRVWSGKPYNSKQIVIAPDVKLVVKDIEIDFAENEGDLKNIIIDGKFFDVFNSETCATEFPLLCENDGLSESDFLSWFGNKPFSGQMLIWNNNNLPY